MAQNSNAIYPNLALGTSRLPFMRWQSQNGGLMLCHSDIFQDHDGTDLLLRLRGNLHAANFIPSPNDVGYQGSFVLHRSQNPSRRAFFIPGIATLAAAQLDINLKGCNLINAIESVDGKLQITLSVIKAAGEAPFRLKDKDGNDLPMRDDVSSLEGADVDVVLIFYHTRDLTQNPVLVQTIARVLDVQLLD
ncbi:hypothetical protein BDN72DRAFT_843579 [Pluteus cervinus]|uniref:Uncharacterized protein n=1 Tax=Pluteus cervinus TaxID=181527 RepID=A0ACD3AMT0_9AGAR|nr:hypothetical protein BDN72DRAFT_843579 [Pluteus cervinus]